MNTDLPVTEVILDILNVDGASSTEEVARLLRYRLRRRVPEDEVAAHLLNLTEEGRVARTPHHQWKALAQPAREARETRAADPSSSPTLVGGHRPARILGGARARQDGDDTDSDRWAFFRRLCLYYIACLREDGGPALSAFPEGRRSSWLSYRGTPPWERLETGGHLGFSYELRRDEADFAKVGMQRRRNHSLFLAYPCQWIVPKSKDKSPFILPILVWPLDVEWDLVSLRCRSDGHYRLNGRWLDGQFRNREDARGFVSAIGLDDGDDPLTFGEVVDRISRFMNDDLAEPLDPAKPSRPPEDLDGMQAGVYGWPLLVHGKQLRYTATLVRELKEIARAPGESLDSSALASLFHANDPEADGPGEAPSLLELTVLNPSQRGAVRAATTARLTAVTGPPGTGKSEVARAVIVNQCLANSSVLLASKNHRAIDAVAPSLNEQVGGHGLVKRPRSNRDAGSWFSWADLLHQLLNAPSHTLAERYAARVEALRSHLVQEQMILTGIRERHELAVATAAAEQQLTEESQQLPPRWRSRDELVGVELPNGETLASMEAEIETLRRRRGGLWGWFVGVWGRRAREARLEELSLQLAVYPSMGVLSGDAQTVGRPGFDPAADTHPWSFWRALRTAADSLARTVELEDTLRVLPSAEELASRVDSSRQRTHTAGLEALGEIANGDHASLPEELRTILTNLASAAANFGEQRVRKQLTQQFPLLLHYFPAWAITNLSVGSTFPLAAGTFDLLVVDEASQCDIPSVIPLLFRTRRATFIGDPMQLRHVTNLSTKREEALLNRYGLTALDVQRFSYRENSIFSLVRSTPRLGPVHFLSDHYRCHESIATFVNRSFYKGQLDVMTGGRPWRHPANRAPGIHWTDIRGEIETPGRGAFCRDEIAAIATELAELEAAGFDGSVGVVTPFRGQADRIRDRLHTTLSPGFIDRTSLEVGTAHAFQGGERDLIVFSLCCGPGLADGAAGFATRPNLFNVAVSRARAVLHVVGNAEWARGAGPAFVRELLLLSEGQPAGRSPGSAVYESPWEERFDAALIAAGIQTTAQYRIAGRRLDLAVLQGDLRLDLEVDGEAWHRRADGRRKDDDVWRDHQLRALGWKVLRFWVYELREDMEGCVGRVLGALGGEQA